MVKLCGIYVITSPSGSIYVGSSIDVKARWSGHRGELRRGKHHCVPLQRAAEKYGIEHLRFEFVASCPRERLRDIEQLVIDAVRPEYNSSKSTHEALSGLWQDPDFRERSRARVGAQMRRQLQDPAFRAKQAAAASKSLTAQFDDSEFRAKHRAAIVKTIAKVNADPILREKAAQARRDRYASDPVLREARSAQLRNVNAANRANPEWVARQKAAASERMKKMRADPAARERNTAAIRARHSKKIVCIETGVVYQSVTLAAEAVGISTGHISSAASGKRKSAGGFTWRYPETVENGSQG
ncbi:GIY-YIG nuclease family protein [Paraburkholderia phytofirmans]|uniref:GIY-YIG nuclease family protein n=1 Tax=Paraburkholderia phytofirmans TaxID=261302 RepID=UPI0038BC3EB3